jgi:eukaryotic-like serine/threonine-protein kinase
MATKSVTDFVFTLRQCQLLDASHEEILARQLQGQFHDAPSLGRELVRRGWLSDYQLDQLLEGNGDLLSLGPYRILDWLGEGGVSQVFKAWHVPFASVVALKVIRPALQENPEAMRQFLFEARVMSQLSHPNIVRVVDVDPVGHPWFYSMEFVEGTDLGKLVQERGPLPVDQACHYIRQAALGLQHAHERGVVHRDIKPVNLLLCEAEGSQSLGLIKILDMGLARLEWSGKGGGSYQGTPTGSFGQVLGTPDFMAPEQATDHRLADIRADIYSLGCTLYFLLAGQPPFPVKSLAQKLVCHQAAQPNPIERIRKEVPPALVAVLQKMMAKAPAERHRTPASVSAALAKFAVPASQSR